MSERLPVWVVIPARNEGANLGRLLEEVHRYADEVIVANDSSTDNTAEVARECGALVVDVPPTRRGLAGVYRCGLGRAVVHWETEFAKASGASDGSPVVSRHNWKTPPIVVEMDAGGSHSPSDIPKFVEEFAEGQVDVVFGRRFGPDARYEGHYKRALLSLGGTMLFNLKYGTNWADATSGFIAYRMPALQWLLDGPWQSEGHFYQTEVRRRVWQLGMTWVEVPITYRNSSSSLNWKSISEALRLL